MRLIVVLIALILPAMAVAETDQDAVAAPFEATMAAIHDSQTRFLDLAKDAINGYGGPGGLSAEALEGAIALERTAARANRLHEFLKLDLNNDGELTADEVTIVTDAASASSRARLLRLVERSDLDKDGRISAEEIDLTAAAAALKAVTEFEAQALRGLLAFDANGNGLVTAKEAELGIAAVVVDDGT